MDQNALQNVGQDVTGMITAHTIHNKTTEALMLATPTAELSDMKTPNQHQMFADRLTKLMQDKELSQSALARLVWGTVKDKRGYEVARNRDRISSYLAGVGIPEQENLKKLAAALNCTPEDLLGPDATARPLTRTKAHIAIQTQESNDRPGWMQLLVNVTLPTRDVWRIVALIDEIRATSTSAVDDDPAESWLPMQPAEAKDPKK